VHFSSGPGAAGIEDILQGMFGGGAAGFGARPRPRPKGSSIEHAVDVGMLEALRGGTLTIRLDRGRGPERVEVKIPAGVRAGQRIRLSGMGRSGPGGPGDLLLEVGVRPHPVLERRGDDVLMDVPVTVAEAVAGATIEVPLWSGGTVGVKVPPGSQSGRSLRLRGLGPAKRSGGDKGDLLIRLSVHVPEESDPEVERLARELSEHYGADVRRDLRL
jgi:molecular chaperone DnaJ